MPIFSATILSQAERLLCLIDEHRHKKVGVNLKISLNLPGKKFKVRNEIDIRLMDKAPVQDPYI